jgi:undecaprenyl diphosphate synthase
MSAIPPPPPLHIACIMDGNGRWASQRGLSRIEGHTAGEKAVLAAVDAALEEGIEWLTLFAFSTENWHRSADEVAFLMKFNEQVIIRNSQRFHAQGIRTRYMGRHDRRIPQYLIERMKGWEDLTKANTRLTLTLAFNFGGRAEIVDMLQAAYLDGVNPYQLSEDSLTAYTQYPDMPDVDLFIRTSGEQRLSNFMLWRSAYAELVFLDVLWPDFQQDHLREAIRHYHKRQRRFGAA